VIYAARHQRAAFLYMAHLSGHLTNEFANTLRRYQRARTYLTGAQRPRLAHLPNLGSADIAERLSRIFD